MAKIIEKEVRSDISKNIYDELMAEFSNTKKKHSFIKNHNFYFDTVSTKLMSTHKTLRIRIIDDIKFEFTLKIKQENGDIEITQHLTEEEANKAINECVFPNGEIKEYIKKHCNLKEKLYKFADLLTNRLEIYYRNYILVIDENKYSDIVDYNIEIETTKDIKYAKKVLIKLSKKYNFEITKNYIGKYHRAINAALKTIYR